MRKEPQKFRYLAGRKIPFLGRWVWKEISEAAYLAGIRQFFTGTSDRDILALVHADASHVNRIGQGLVYRTGRKLFRAELRGD